ncbi:S8 family peptidase [Candidatus Poribacteria bacterium]|nr:S8 family peptidase [Candidatus Poribacteria bacterium]
MLEKPLLMFPKPTNAPRKKEKPRFGSEYYHQPTFQEQKDRLTPQFESMNQSFISATPGGIEPESVLVIETIGKIDDFQRAVRAIPGLEWLAEIDEEEIASDEVFYQVPKIQKRLFYEKIDGINSKQSSKICKLLKENGFIDKDGSVTNKNFGDFKQLIPEELLKYKEKIISTIENEVTENKKNPISGRLFLSMSNQQAMEKLLSLWKKWDNEDKKLPRGYAKWLEIFKNLRSIRKWDTKDRLRDTGIENFWKEELNIKKGTASKIPFEIELWYKKDEIKRREILKKIEQLINEEKGRIITSCTIAAIRFHAVKAELPPESIEKAIDSQYTKIFCSNDIMFFRPIGQSIREIYSDGEEGDFKVGEVSGQPVVAILDGAPFSNHSLLKNRLNLDDPDNFESTYQANERRHGTAMASLICHSELDAREEPLSRPVYFRPIMKPNPEDPRRTENIPKDIFWEDLIERSVHRIFEGDGKEEAVAPTVKIINLSICDPSRIFFNQLSSCARLLDWLSEKYQVLFCVSAGNINDDIDLKKNQENIKNLSDEELTKLTIQTIQENIRDRKIFAPADSINAITIGAIHTDKSSILNKGIRIDILPNQNLPSPISALGFGFRKSIKPEIYIPGGRQLYDYTTNKYKISDSGEAPGQRVATAPVNPGETNRCVYTRGTSNSSALASRGAAQIYEMLNSLMNENGYIIEDKNIAVILKALLVHSASWRDNDKILEAYLKNESNPFYFKRVVARYIGFGIPDISRVLECTAQRATAIGYGEIKKNEKHDFRFPLPPSLSGLNEMRRLTITLAWFSPIDAGNRKYRKANLSIDPPTDIIGVDRINADWQQVKNGTVQHEVLEGSKVVSYADGDFLNISVVCREDAGNLDEEVQYGLAVTLETAESVGIPIYEEIRERINVSVPIKEYIS